MSPPLGSRFYVNIYTPSQDAIYPQLGEVGHIIDSCIPVFHIRIGTCLRMRETDKFRCSEKANRAAPLPLVFSFLLKIQAAEDGARPLESSLTCPSANTTASKPRSRSVECVGEPKALGASARFQVWLGTQ